MYISVRSGHNLLFASEQILSILIAQCTMISNVFLNINFKKTNSVCKGYSCLRISYFFLFCHILRNINKIIKWVPQFQHWPQTLTNSLQYQNMFYSNNCNNVSTSISCFNYNFILFFFWEVDSNYDEPFPT